MAPKKAQAKAAIAKKQKEKEEQQEEKQDTQEKQHSEPFTPLAENEVPQEVGHKRKSPPTDSQVLRTNHQSTQSRIEHLQLKLKQNHHLPSVPRRPRAMPQSYRRPEN